MNQIKYDKYSDHLIELVAFIKRPGMYVGKDDMDLILAFICGFMASTKFEISIINDLTEYIFNRHIDNEELQALKKNLNYYTLKDQIQLLAKQNELTVGQKFREEGLQFLVDVSDNKLKGAYKSQLVEKLKNALRQNLSSKNEKFTKSFSFSPEDQIFKQFNEWPGISLNEEQLNILMSINKENSERNLRWMKQEQDEIDDKSKLRQLSNELLEKITRDNNR